MKRTFFAILVLAGACATEEPAEKATTLAELMKVHFVHAEDMRDALVNGDVVNLHARAKSLSQSVEIRDLPPAYREHLDAMRAAAARIDGEYDIRQAARRFADLARACADCHQMTATTPPIKDYPAPPPDTDVSTHMLRHAWAAARMWEGLIAPSDEKWRIGASVVASEPLAPEVFLGRPASNDLTEQATRLHELGVKAVNASTQQERAALYSEFIGSCSECHRAVRTVKPSP